MADLMEIENYEGEVVDNELMLELKKPYEFEGKTYEKIDLRKLENMTTKDLIATNNLMMKKGGYSPTPEMTLDFCCILANRATKIPLEFFYSLSVADAMNLKNKVTNFLYE